MLGLPGVLAVALAAGLAGYHFCDVQRFPDAPWSKWLVPSSLVLWAGWFTLQEYLGLTDSDEVGLANMLLSFGVCWTFYMWRRWRNEHHPGWRRRRSKRVDHDGGAGGEKAANSPTTAVER